jgi:hypothetical protein
MSVTPSGSPAWTRTADHTQYGGDTNKTNYMSQGVIDARTDVGAEQLARLAEDLAACARTAPFATLTYTCNDTSPAAPSIAAAFLMTGVNTAGYEGDAAPSGFPSAARNGNGDVTFTFASSYTDAYGVSGALTITNLYATVHGSTAAYATTERSGSTVRVRAWNSSGTALSDATISLEVGP